MGERGPITEHEAWMLIMQLGLPDLQFEHRQDRRHMLRSRIEEIVPAHIDPHEVAAVVEDLRDLPLRSVKEERVVALLLEHRRIQLNRFGPLELEGLEWLKSQPPNDGSRLVLRTGADGLIRAHSYQSKDGERCD